MESGSREDLFLEPTHPYTLGLFGSLPKLDDDSKRLTPIPGQPPDPTEEIEGCPFAPRCSKATEACWHGEVPFTELSSGHFVRCININKEAN